MSSTRPLIIGSGIAGSAAAIALVRGGTPALLLEKSRETGDAICGGFLSWQSLAALDRIGLDRAALGGSLVSRVRLFAGDRMVEARLPQPGMGLSRYRLDTLLLDAAIAAGTAVERGVAVKAVEHGAALTGDGATIASDAIFVATGKYNLPGTTRSPPGRAADDPVIGLRLRIGASRTVTALVGGAVELFLFDRGYAGLVVQEDGSANLCLAVHKSRLGEAGGRPDTLIAAWGAENPRLGERLAAGAQVGGIDAIAAVPYGWRASSGTAGIWRLGDQAACIPSLAGEGMGIALAASASAVAAWRHGMGAEQWQAGFGRRVARPMALARMAWAAAETPRWNGAGLALLGRAPMLLDWLARATRVPT
jgi:menaquinone-9 beta-reductase